MSDPSFRTSRLAIAGLFLGVLAVGGTGFFLGRVTLPEPPPPPAPIEAPAPDPASAPPPPVSLLDRGGIIRLAREAADAFASGAAMPQSVTEAAGRRFDLAIPFGCAGPSDAGSRRSMHWRYDAAEEALRATVIPAAWSGADWGLESGPEVMSVKGFWIPRPWSSSDNCPPQSETPVPAGADAITLPGQTLAIAQVSASQADGVIWSGDRPFEAVQRMAPEQAGQLTGLRLRVTGRIAGLRGQGPVRCRQLGGTEQRPICVVAAQMEDIRIELPATGEVLGVWSVDR